MNTEVERMQVVIAERKWLVEFLDKRCPSTNRYLGHTGGFRKDCLACIENLYYALRRGERPKEQK